MKNIFIGLALILFYACQKENSSVVYSNLVIDTTASSEFITRIDSDAYDQCKIDFNNDHQCDIEFDLKYYTLMGGSDVNFTNQIKILSNDFEVEYSLKSDTIATYTETIPYSGGTAQIYVSENYVSTVKYPSDLELNVQFDTFINPRSNLDTIKESDNWTSGVFLIRSAENFSGIPSIYHIYKSIMNDSMTRFIGVRYRKDNRYYYGWIEVKLFYNKVHIVRICMQR